MLGIDNENDTASTSFDADPCQVMNKEPRESERKMTSMDVRAKVALVMAGLAVAGGLTMAHETVAHGKLYDNLDALEQAAERSSPASGLASASGGEDQVREIGENMPEPGAVTPEVLGQLSNLTPADHQLLGACGQ